MAQTHDDTDPAAGRTPPRWVRRFYGERTSFGHILFISICFSVVGIAGIYLALSATNLVGQVFAILQSAMLAFAVFSFIAAGHVKKASSPR
ncbi:hypothetical protein [Nesterenkonia flava]|uniref:Uncharacterized protein n=1 Tax=Nesterenkonia flava TaxID=469799 RepID=A0ABU1FQ72_9MICC|nr:hypothetical protein [Nesterenkonia flava]MDR5710795.1 hypothetical protein [Nesterenkonia flava]